MKKIIVLLSLAIVALVAIGCGSTPGVTPPPEVYAPAIKIDSVYAITDSSATVLAEITSDGGGKVIDHGVIVNGIKDSLGAGTKGSFICQLALKPGTSYTIQAYIFNGSIYENGIGYSGIVKITTLYHYNWGANVTDADGNVYKTIIIGTQTWLAENLKVTHYNNGDPIPNVTDEPTWSSLTTGALCAYNNDSSNVKTYGYLYNYFVVTDPRGICPNGWHVPSQAEWETLSQFLGGDGVSGGALKEAGTAHWKAPNSGATNSSGFTALPAGLNLPGDPSSGYLGSYQLLHIQVTFWTTTNFMGMYTSFGASMANYNAGFMVQNGGDDYPMGLSIRLVKN